MKNKVLIAVAFVLSAFSIFCADIYAKKTVEEPEATITCSAGDKGRCFRYVATETTIPWYICQWSGKQADNCNDFGIVIRGVKDYL